MKNDSQKSSPPDLIRWYMLTRRGLSGLVVETIASGEQSGEYKITPVE
jgi:hypothetical protein